jgi:hypothetical protein
MAVVAVAAALAASCGGGSTPPRPSVPETVTFQR